jgi:hypothetical protein
MLPNMVLVELDAVMSNSTDKAMQPALPNIHSLLLTL